MIVKQYLIKTLDDFQLIPSDNSVNVVLGFGEKSKLAQSLFYNNIKSKFGNARVALCSSAGEIFNTDVYDNVLSIACLSFKYATVECNKIQARDYANGFDAGVALVSNFVQDGLKYLLVLSDGAVVNGSELIKGMASIVPANVPITGGLAGDGTSFQYTLVGLDEIPQQGSIIGIGFYGDRLKVGHGSYGGWEPFGLEKTITKSNQNVLYEIDHKNALDMYKLYLGKFAKELPQSALLFPLAVQLNKGGDYLVRTILSIDNENEVMTFAGDVPEGSKVRFMKANFDRLVDAASTAANTILSDFDISNPQFALLISCVGRKLVLGERIDEEVEAVADVLGSQVPLTGYYSYGEISPLRNGAFCELQNQTMTITCLEELE